MKVYELIAKLMVLEAGAEVYLDAPQIDEIPPVEIVDVEDGDVVLKPQA